MIKDYKKRFVSTRYIKYIFSISILFFCFVIFKNKYMFCYYALKIHFFVVENHQSSHHHHHQSS